MLPEADKINIILENEDLADGGMSIASSSYTGAPSASKSGHDETQDQAAKEEMRDEIISEEERKAVRRARNMVVGAFITCATAVSVAVYKYASKADFRSFELEVRRCLGDDNCFLCTSNKGHDNDKFSDT
jgi:hypothetical protein